MNICAQKVLSGLQKLKLRAVDQESDTGVLTASYRMSSLGTNQPLNLPLHSQNENAKNTHPRVVVRVSCVMWGNMICTFSTTM